MHRGGKKHDGSGRRTRILQPATQWVRPLPSAIMARASIKRTAPDDGAAAWRGSSTTIAAHSWDCA